MSKPSLRSGKKDSVAVIVVAAIALLLGLNLFFLFDGSQEGFVGQEAPDFALPVFGEDDLISVSDFRGKVVVLDFWATWCPPCLEQMPALEALATDPELADTVQILSINTDEDEFGDREMKVELFLVREQLSMTTLLDDGEARRLYEVGAIPALFIIGPDGRVTYESRGVHDEALLREKIGQAI